MALEMMLPVGGLWGTELYSAPVSFELGTVYRILAAVDGTTVTVDAGGGNIQTIQLSQNEFQELNFTNSGFNGLHITSNAPILVTQYGGNLPNGSWGGSIPFEMQLIPVTSYAQSVAFYGQQNPSGYQFTNEALIIAPAAAVGAIQLNGAAVPASLFKPLPGGQFVYAEVAGVAGGNTVTSPQPMAVYSVGYSSWGAGSYISSYGSPARF
jgi:hypothetical protein